VNRIRTPVLVALLVTILMGAAGGEVTAVEPRAAVRSIMIPAPVFTPARSGLDYNNNGSDVSLASGSGDLLAPLSFPAAVVNIKKITIYALDNNPAAKLCVTLYRTKPLQPEENAGEVCTGDSSSFQIRDLTTLSPRRVNTALQGSHLRVYFTGPDVFLSAVKVTYSHETP